MISVAAIRIADRVPRKTGNETYDAQWTVHIIGAFAEEVGVLPCAAVHHTVDWVVTRHAVEEP